MTHAEVGELANVSGSEELDCFILQNQMKLRVCVQLVFTVPPRRQFCLTFHQFVGLLLRPQHSTFFSRL